MTTEIEKKAELITDGFEYINAEGEERLFLPEDSLQDAINEKIQDAYNQGRADGFMPAFVTYTTDETEVKSDTECREGYFLTESELEALKREYFEAGHKAAMRWANKEVIEFENFDDYEQSKFAKE